MTQSHDSRTNNAKPSKWKMIRSSPWFHLAAALLLVAVVHGFVVKPYSVPSGSMEQTLNVGDRIYVNKLPIPDTEVKRGDVVVFNASETWEKPVERGALRQFAGTVGDFFGFGPSNHKALVKRVIGTPGDVVSCCTADGALSVNGEALDEPYIFEDIPFQPGTIDCATQTISARCFRPIELGEDQYLMLGDHRSNSSDSVTACRGKSGSPDPQEPACAKIVLEEDLVGKVVFRIWPLSEIGGIS